MPEAVTRNVRVHVESEFAPGRSSPAAEQVVFPLHDPHHQRRRRDGPAVEPSLDYHRRDGRGARGAGSWRRRQAARARAGRELRIHIGLRPDHAVRHDARNLSDGDRASAKTSKSRFRRSRSPNPTRRCIRPARPVRASRTSSRRSHRRSAGTPPQARRRCRAASSRDGRRCRSGSWALRRCPAG